MEGNSPFANGNDSDHGMSGMIQMRDIVDLPSVAACCPRIIIAAALSPCLGIGYPPITLCLPVDIPLIAH
ncbi:hypothetical protein GYMLUDRAFT_251095 [Collybiopsis luxurians FD-317 M1]|uniref:Uncharacterized protein n=1 Tax=Collybiopsis luxurians FD-317 M1 TaxID=944289 RepID=A0A0D0CCI3_9AGAR|nr:hypothetical protein GYMLUDRAFT_251095 [Collybiopsis luxurians FD-317 M1]